MWRAFLLILPGLIPSWEFFKSIEPSPRVQWRAANLLPPAPWVPYRPRPQSVTPLRMLRRLVWNPDWNDDLFMVSLSERLSEAPTEHSLQEIKRRIEREAGAKHATLEFRLIFVHRDGQDIVQDVLYHSAPWVCGARP